MNRTKIEWVKNPDGTQGYTWNPITGCLGPYGTPSLPGRCPYCYARRLARGRLKNRYLSWKQLSSIPFLGEPLLSPNTDSLDPFAPRFWPSRLDDPHKLKKPSTIFVCSMGEPFSQYYPFQWFANICNVFWECPRHTFLVLTKNPQKATNLVFPSNVCLGVTATSSIDWPRVVLLLRSKAKVKFISFEPLLEDASNISLDWVDWVIIGAQTQPYIRPKSEWVFRIIDKAKKEGIPVFLKNNLHWPEKIQEFPPELRGKVGTNSQTSPRIPTKSGEPAHRYLPDQGSPNDKILYRSQGQHLHSDKEAK